MQIWLNLFWCTSSMYSGWCIWSEETRADARECRFTGTVTFNAGKRNVMFQVLYPAFVCYNACNRTGFVFLVLAAC